MVNLQTSTILPHIVQETETIRVAPAPTIRPTNLKPSDLLMTDLIRASVHKQARQLVPHKEQTQRHNVPNVQLHLNPHREELQKEAITEGTLEDKVQEL
jgi:hypothetical protein